MTIGQRSSARRWTVLFALVIVLPASAATAAPHRSTAFDEDPFSISGSGASANGTVSWSRGSDPRVVRARISGELRKDGDGCARLSVSWLNSANSTIGSDGRRVCDGDSTGLGFSFGSAGLECVRIGLGAGGSSRVLCAGGS